MRATLRMTGTLFALIACCAVPAQAQLGGFIKKAAKKAVANKVDETVESTTPVKPMAGDPLTETSLDALLKGLSLELETRGRTKALTTAIEAKAMEVIDAERAAGGEPDAWHKASDGAERCISNSLDKSRATHEREVPEKMMALVGSGSNSDVIAKLEAVGKAMRDAQARNDMKAYVKAFEGYAKMLGFDIRKDSAAAFAACGKLPAKPASLLKIERLQAEVDKMNEERRVAETESDALAAKAAGMPADKYALARERLWAWSAARSKKEEARALTKDENTLFAARATDIKRIASMLR